MTQGRLVKLLTTMIVIFFVITPVVYTPQSPTAIAQQTIYNPISPQRYIHMLGIGINVNWVLFNKVMQAYTPSVPIYFHQIGFSHVRIRANIHTDMAKLKQVVDDSLKAGLIPIIAFSASELKEHPSPTTVSQAVQWWTSVATTFKGYPYTLAYDLIIEPSGNINNHIDTLNSFYTQTIRAIRNIDPYRLIFVSPPFTSSPFHLKDLDVPWDPYTMAQWHFFAAGPSTKNPAKKWTIGTQEEKDNIWRYITAAKQWSNKTHIYTWVGAWMPGNYNHGDNISIGAQMSFASYMSCSLLFARIPFAINAGTKFFDYTTYTWRPDRYPVLMSVLYPCPRGGPILAR